MAQPRTDNPSRAPGRSWLPWLALALVLACGAGAVAWWWWRRREAERDFDRLLRADQRVHARRTARQLRLWNREWQSLARASADGEGVRALRQALDSVASALRELREAGPAAWDRARNRLDDACDDVRDLLGAWPPRRA